jgi:hypothetical protein
MVEKLPPNIYGGSGSGLALCLKIAEALDEFIEAKGETGKGSAFSYILAVDNLTPPPEP